MKMKINSNVDDEHEEFLSLIRTRLRSIEKSFEKKIDDEKTSNRLISIRIRRFDATSLNIEIDENQRIFHLKKQIEKQFENQKNLHWKSIWKRYVLLNENQEELIDSNRRIRSYQIHHNSQLTFAKTYRRKSTIDSSMSKFK